ncbi:hypothetical protein [Nonomuraea lactucae]|uniref:hypothetical protein n=1 Tax=Nonomuraea lactucae TaxID=2249762 RepID=UPI0019628527|nr:hypothetical protein [Nonomuraea lactucae]
MFPTSHRSPTPTASTYRFFSVTGLRRKPRRQWRTAKLKPWASSGGFPASDGWYVSTTTWREIIKAAIEVGRDVTPHLQNQPRYAHGELVARVSPLYAYLGMHPVTPQYPVRGTKDRRLTLNPGYAYGTERSAKNAAAYRLGMTMTEWACRSLLGLGQSGGRALARRCDRSGSHRVRAGP